MRRVLHRIEVIEIAEELVEAVDGRQELVEIAQMVLAELAGGVALRFERSGDGDSLGWQSGLGSRPGRPWSSRCEWVAAPVTKLARPAVQLASA